jgi:hypothetical protein
MQDVKVEMEKLLHDAAECKLVSDLATDAEKRALFARLADHLMTVADEVRRFSEQQIPGERSH